MALTIEQIKDIILPNNLTDNKSSSTSQPTFGINHTGTSVYDIVALIVDDLNVGTATLVSNTLVDNLNGTYTWTPIAGASFLINTHAGSNPINTIVGLTATTVQTALEQLYAAVSTNGGFAHPAVTVNAFSNPALVVDLVTQVATLDLNATNSLTIPTSFATNTIEGWMTLMEACCINNVTLLGSPNATDLGTFAGTIITDNVSVTQALQELENAITLGQQGSTSTYTDNLDGTYTLTNNSVTGPSSVIVDTTSINNPLSTNLTFDFTSIGGTVATATSVQGALEQLLLCCEHHLGILQGGTVLGGTVTTTGAGTGPISTNTGLGILPAGGFNIVDGFTQLEISMSERKPIILASGTNPIITIDTLAAGADKINIDLTVAGSYETAGNSILTTNNIQGVITAVDTELAKTRTSIIGVGATDSNLGAFTGATITAGGSVKSALQEVVTALEALAFPVSIMTDNSNGTYTHNDGSGTSVIIDTNAASAVLSAAGITATNVQDGILELLAKHTDLAAMIGATGTNLGTFTGSTITDNVSIKQALQFLETAVEAAGNTSSVVDNFNGTYTHNDGTGTLVTIDTNAASSVVTATGNLTSTTVQTALVELQTEIDGLVTHDAVTLNALNNPALIISGQELKLDINATGSYANGTSGLASTDIQGAIDEVVTMINGNVSTLVNNGNSTYTHTGGTGVTTVINTNALALGYDNGLSGLTALTVQAAIDEIAAAATATQYLSAVAFVPSTGVFTHTDGNGITANFTFNALNTPFTATGNTVATNVQAAIVELQSEIDGLAAGNTSVMTDNADGTYVHSDGAAVPTLVTINTNKTAADIVNVPSGSLVATNVQTAIDELDGNVSNLVTLTGVALDAVDLGTFTGTTIADNSTIKVALQALEDATLTADNGLTPLAVVGAPDKIQLGGALTQSTTVDAAAFQLFLQDTPGVHQLQIDNATASLRGTNAALELTGGTFNVKTNGYTGAGSTYTTAGKILQNVNILTGESEYTPYALPLVDGTVGQELVTDGAGNVTWRTRPEMLSFQEFLRVEPLVVRNGETLWAVPSPLDGWQLQSVKSIVATTGANDFTADFILGGTTTSITHTGGTAVTNIAFAQTVAEDDFLELNVTAVGASVPSGWTVELTFNRIV